MTDFEDIKHYSFFASYLVNNDKSGLSEKELRTADRFVEDIKELYGDSASIVSADDDHEFASPEWGGLKGDVITYQVQYNTNELPGEHWVLDKDRPELTQSYRW